jgi:hypothetical protein
MNIFDMSLDELRLAVEELRRYPAALQECEAEVKRLQAIVDKLPKTADGVPVVPGMNCYFRSHPHGTTHKDAGVVCVTLSYDGDNYEAFLRDGNGDEWWAILPEEVYSTREAAQAAKETDGGQN